MKMGMIGLANSGKSTIFNALSGAEVETAPYTSMKDEPHLAVIDVADERVDWLSGYYQPKKTTFAQIELVDFAGLTEGAARSGLFPPQSMALIKTADALALIVRNFHEPTIDQAQGVPDPVSEVEHIETELKLSDMIVVEKRLERIELSYKRGVKTNEIQQEEKLLRRAHTWLEDDNSLRDFETNSEEDKILRGFQFLSRKPILVVLNSGEDEFGHCAETVTELQKRWQVMEFAGEFEMELARLETDEAQMFMEDMGITESARDRLTHLAYRLLGYISFFTVGKDEVRAWTIRRGDTALEAAGRIHSDLARGFIRADVFAYDDMRTCGSEKGMREKGLLRLESRDYLVNDGEIVHVRFNV
ncbi:MAG: redox-regulated ATPase YchF [Candidatus Cloacimonetes bacterium]|nr:redox-regulated ATPase YchF [Candidatus Cloacimonadota bacterium]